MYMLGVIFGFLLLWAISFGVFCAIAWLLCAVLAIKFVLRYVIAAYLICLLIRWMWNTK